MNIIYTLGGLALLFLGGELLVKASVTIARTLGLSSLLIGLTVVGFGTSSPEFFVSLEAALNNNTDIAIGNIVGSNIANILLILGLAAILYPVNCSKPVIMRDAAIVVLTSIILALLSFYHVITRPAGLAMFIALVLYILYSYLMERKNGNGDFSDVEVIKDKAGLIKAVLTVMVSLALLYFGAHWLITGSVEIAKKLGVPDAVIGLTLVAVGTSLPELATTIVAALRKHSDIAIGNILGSNLFNILGILGVTAVISPLNFSGRIAMLDVWIMLAVAVLLLALVRVNGQIGRVTGIIFVLAYTAYTVWAYTGTPGVL